MRSHLKLALITGALALSAAPATAMAAGPPSGAPPANRGTEHAPSTTPGAGATLPAKARAYGRYCRGESREHVAGTPGTPFSLCVTAMAKLANGAVGNPRVACRAESKRRVEGQRGTPFSQCVAGGAKLRREESRSATPGAGATLPAKARAYGRYCRGESREHVAGTPGTPFSLCVTAMAKLANGTVGNPRAACRTESRRRVEGQRGTPFSRCVAGAAKLRREEMEESAEE